MVSTLPIGSCVDRYQIQGVLGKGGFGITYVAVDTQIGLRVAIKELLPDTIATRAEGATVIPQTESMWENWQWARDRFVEEAQILAGFSHPAIVGIHSLMEANGTVYMVMDLVDGESYESRLKRIGREADQESLMQIFEPILDGLQEVHSKELLHRDIKPENILIGAQGQPVLIDFGSARTSIGATMTMTSIVTHGYSPIEQYQTKGRMGPWTDIYALGAVMCRAITGEKPPVAADRVIDDDFRWLSYRKINGYKEAFLNAVDWALRIRTEERPIDLSTWKFNLMSFEPQNTLKKLLKPEKIPVDDMMIFVDGGVLPSFSNLPGRIVESFYIGRNEVTWLEWKIVRDWAVDHEYDLANVGKGSGDDHPVRDVSWFDVLKWCNAKSERDGFVPVYTANGGVYRSAIPRSISCVDGANGYRLPSEAEWEWAARGGLQSRGYQFSGSNSLDDVGWYQGNSTGSIKDLYKGQGTWPIAKKAPNELGLYDMSGNLWEWCWDGAHARKILGGSWFSYGNSCEVAFGGFSGNPEDRDNCIGFRPVRGINNSK